MDKKIRMEVEAEMSAVTSDIENIRNGSLCKKLGSPVLLLLAPGMVNAAENIPVAISVETTMQKFAVPFVQDSASFRSSLCSLVNSSLGVRPSEFFISMNDGCINFFTSCNIKNPVLELNA